jgi:nitric oxide reductase NorD protein
MVFEPEESVGHLWHRLVGDTGSYARHPDAAASLDAVRGRLAVLFRAMGGNGSIRIAAVGESAVRARLGWRQRLGSGRERVARPLMDTETLGLPAVIDLFPDRPDNERLYEWLVCWFAHAATPPDRPADPLQADVATLRHAAATTSRALLAWPGLRPVHGQLAAALLRQRPRRPRGAQEEAVEAAVRALLSESSPTSGHAAEDVLNPAVPLTRFTAAARYRPFLPVPLWGELRGGGEAAVPRADETRDAAAGKVADDKRRRATRSRQQRRDQRDPLVLHRFESLMTAAEMVNLDRDVDDDEAEAARQAANDMDELTLGRHDRRAAAALKLDLAIPVEGADAAPLMAELTYPEWDYRRRAWLPVHCRVVAEAADEEGAEWTPDAAARRRIRQTRRYFEALRPRRMVLTAQADGDDLDLAALVRARADLRAGNAASDRVYLAVRDAARDLAVAVLVDVSLSTEQVIEGHRVLDVEKEALMALTLGLRACGDAHAIFTFTSRRRRFVHVRTVKDFDEALSAAVLRRIQALRPGHYTRMGAAIRHVASRLDAQAHRHRLLLLLTDGKPNDIDHYEGRHGIEDTRMAIREARRVGLSVFGITVDEQARDYFPYIFGPGAYAIFPHVARLTHALPAIYRQVAT